MPECAPPQSLAAWSVLLMCGAIALGIEALALLFTLRAARGGSWGGFALRSVVIISALAVAAWSLWIRASAQTIYQGYVARFDVNAYICYGGQHHPSPEGHAAFMRHMQAEVGPIERTAAIAIGAAVILLILGAYIRKREMQRSWRAASPHTASA